MVSDLHTRFDALVRPIEDWPVQGVTFRDITPLLADPAGLREVMDALIATSDGLGDGAIDAVIGIEARGFIFAPSVAIALNAGFVPVRKAGKLPALAHRVSYDLEYGQATLEMHTDALKAGDRVLVIDDVLATGGTLEAAAALVCEAGATVVANLVLIEIEGLGGRDRLANVPTVALGTY